MRPPSSAASNSRLGPLLAAILFAACGGDKKPPIFTPEPEERIGYGDLRVLTHEECVSLRDRQIELAVSDALSPDTAAAGGGDAGAPPAPHVDAALRRELESKLREKNRDEGAAWVKRCEGKTARARDVRCFRDATSVATFTKCGALEDDAQTGASGPIDRRNEDTADGGPHTP